MKLTLIICVGTLACAYARVANPPGAKPLKNKWSKRVERDLKWEQPVGNGKVYGTLGRNGDGLYGTNGFKQEIFNDERGKLVGQVYGSRVLGPAGDLRNIGGKLSWSNKDSKAILDWSKRIGGDTKLKAPGEGLWDFNKNTPNPSLAGDKGKPVLGLKALLQSAL